jgi:TPR repeat protein
MRRAMSGTAHSPLSGSQEKLLSEKSLQGDLESAAELGRVYFDEDFMKAKPWLELAAELGDTESSYLLGIGLQNLKAAAEEKEGKPDEARDRDEVIKQINDAKKEARRARKERIKSSRQKTAAGSSDGVVVTSSSSVSSSYAEDIAEEVETAEHWLRKAAREGHTSAMVLLANILTEEDDAFPKQEALKWYRQAATLQHPDALFNLGTLHFNGIDGGILEPDEKASLAFFEQAAELGDHASQYVFCSTFLLPSLFSSL